MKKQKINQPTGKTIFLFALVLLFFLTLPIAFAPFNNCPGDTTNGWWDISNTQTVNTTQNITCEYINISSGGRLYINSSIGNVTVNITVGNLTIQSGGEINGTGTGFRNETGEGRGGSAGGGSGGGHGGMGSIGEGGSAPGQQYGNPLEPRTLGSGGGDNTKGADGGGSVLINVSNITWVNGTIAINGEPQKTSAGGGGGAGGSLYLDTDQLYGTGTLEAQGGRGRAAAGNDGGSGGGGRIAVYYKTVGEGFTFNRTNVRGGVAITTGVDPGEPGTAVFIQKDNRELYIVGGFDFTLATYNYSNVTIEHAFLRANRTFELNATQLINTGGRVTNMSCYNISYDVTVRILRGVSFDNINESDMGASYIECGNMTIHRTETRTNLTVNRLTILSNGTTVIFNVTDDDLVLNATLFFGNINITNLTNLSISSTSILNATAFGHENGTGEGRGTGGNSAPCGGSYGGLGGRGNSCTAPTAQYGDPFAPRHLGSPSGAASNGGTKGRDGGGLIYINVSGTLWNNGTIVADGDDTRSSPTTGIGGGSGGSIWIDSNNYYGTGFLYARGGRVPNSANDGGSGGGGRIAVYYNAINSEVAFNTTQVNTRYVSGIGASSVGDPGTAVFIDKDDRNLYIVEGFDFNLATYNFSNVTIEHAFLRVNRTFELNATQLINTGDRITNMSCYNSSSDWTFRSLRVLGLDNINVSDDGQDYSDCGNATIHRLETRTNFTVNLLTITSNKTIIFNVTADDLILNATLLSGNLNLSNLANISIYSTSLINATGKGNRNGTFEGTGTLAAAGGGGGYGGIGGDSETGGNQQGRQYGDPFAPSLFGAPGGAGNSGAKPGLPGGGIIYLNISGTFWNNGTIYADGEDSLDTSTTSPGAGSGGSIWIETVNYYGTGSLFARGGFTDNAVTDAGGGGGGRIAVYYNTTNSEVFFNRTSVISRTYSNVAGSLGDPGTAVFIDKDDRNLYIVEGFDFNLATYNYSNVTIEHAFLRVNTTFELNATQFINTGGRITNMSCYNTSHDWTFRSLRVLGLDNINVSDLGQDYSNCGNATIHRLETRTNFTVNLLTITSNKTIIFNVTADDLILNATLLSGNMNLSNLANISIYSTSLINATGKGNRNGTFEGTGTLAAAAGGGGYGGLGGDGQTAGIQNGRVYGDPFAPSLFGAPGGAGNSGAKAGLPGGGIIYLNISGTFWNNGTIYADGEDSLDTSTTGPGAGSGGSIWIDAVNYYGTGSLFSRGGLTDDSTTDSGGGGGGRIAVYYNTTNSEVFFNRTSVISRTDSNVAGSLGDPGTAVFIDKDDRNLYIVGGFDFNLATYNYSNVTIEHAFLRVNRTFELNATYFTNTGSRMTNMSCYNTSYDITFKVLRDIGLDNFNMSDHGVDYSDCGNISIHRVETRTNYSVSTLTIISNATLKFNVTVDDLILSRTILRGSMNFSVVNMSINGTSSLLANFVGYWNGTGPGTGVSRASGGGAGYGGSGGAGSVAGSTGGPTYGSNVTPSDYGSGGAGSNTSGPAYGGNGGGFIFINASNRLEVNGTINASGQAGSTTSVTSSGGGGSGGSIWIWTRILNGTGILSAHGGNGANAGTNDGGGGGGGRIAVYFRNDQSNGFTKDVRGGEGFAATDGAAGTVEFLQTNDTTNPTVTTLRPVANTNVTWNFTINISVTVTDNDEVNSVYFNLTYPDNATFMLLNLSTNLTQVGSIYNFTFNATQVGTYNITFYANDTSGNINQTEKTNFTSLDNLSTTTIDIANTTNITFTPDPIRQNDIVSFNATFNVTGNINATGLNVTLTVDNTFITSTSFNLVNGTTRVVELNWTAENGTHAIRLNADANNTFTTETFENNNNATATVTVLNVSVLNFSSPANNAEINRGLDTSSLPGEDTMKRVTNLTTIQARVHNRYATGTGVNSNCTFYFNNTIFLGWNQTNTTGECTFTFDHTIYATAIYNITVNYTNLNTTNYLADTNSSLIQNRSLVDLGRVEINLVSEELRTGSLYNPGDVAIMNITVTKNGTAFDPNQFTVEIKNPGTECTSTGGILFNHSYPGDVVRLEAGLFQSYSVVEVDTDIHWCVVVNNSNALALGSATHSDREIANTNANRANFTTLNSADGGDDAVFDDINITFITRTGRKIFDRNFSTTDPGERRVITLNDRYDVLFLHSGRQEQLNITGLNITSGNRSLPFTLLTNYTGGLPSNFTNITSIIAFNNSGFTFTTANITLQKANLTISKILHCTNWNFSAGSCIGNWEINQTSAYANYGENTTHFWFQVAGFTAYGGGNGSNANLTIYDQNDTEGGSQKAELSANINFTANYTKLSDRSAITGATCNVSFSTAPVGPSAMTYDSTKQIYNFTRTFSSEGNFTWNVTCGGSGFDTTNASDTIEIVDTTGPTVRSITPIVVTSEATVTFSATVTDSGTVSGCNLFVAGVNDGAMTLSGSTASRAVLQSHPRVTIVEMYANCTDTAGNRNFTRTNITVEPLQSGGGNPGGGTRAGGESSAATADGLEGGTRYEAGEQGDVFSIDEHGVQSYVHVVAVLPNSVRIDVGGLYNIVLLEGLFRKFDLNRNGIMETTIYIDEIVSYSKVDFSILVEDDGGAPVQATPQNFFTLADIWEKVQTQEEQETGEEQGEVPKQEEARVEESREEIPLLQTPSIWARIANALVQTAHAVQQEASITGGAVVTETNAFVSSTILKNTVTKISTILIITIGLLGSGMLSTYVSGRRCKKREEELDALLEKEMQYKGLQ